MTFLLRPESPGKLMRLKGVGMVRVTISETLWVSHREPGVVREIRYVGEHRPAGPPDLKRKRR